MKYQYFVAGVTICPLESLTSQPKHGTYSNDNLTDVELHKRYYQEI
jgi:hypothetical protein